MQVLLVFSLKLFYYYYYYYHQFHELQFSFVTWIKYYFIKKANGLYGARERYPCVFGGAFL
jgi:hypothetical protein